MTFTWERGDLNDQQVDAITHEGSVFLVACPGSGKTRALTYKIALELSRLQSEKHWVIAITYTHRAAEEIEERIERLGVDTTQLWIGTIHSFCMEWIIRPYAPYHDDTKFGFRIIDEHERARRLDALGQHLDPRIRAIHCDYVISPTNGLQIATRDSRLQAGIREVIKRYWSELRAERLADFEMILRYAHSLITRNPTIAVLLGNILKFILVDEFQDTKEIQYSILGEILRAASGQSQVFLVGDPNQAIYGSLGGYAMSRADFANLTGLELAEKSLSLNYRSSTRVVEYFSKYCVTQAAISAEGRDRNYASLISFEKEINHQAVDDEIVRLIRFNIEQRGILPREICVVGPQWVQLADLTRRLMGALPQYNFDGPGMAPFSRDQDNFWFKVARLALTEPSPQLFVRRMRWALEVIIDLRHAGVAVGALTARDLLRRCNGIIITVDDGLEYLRLFFEEFCLTVGFEMVAYPALAEHHEAFFARSLAATQRLAAAGVQGVSAIGMFRRVFANRTGITISTIHGVKGTEFDTVIAFAMLQGMVPHFSDQAGDESANKLMYVVSSRPRKNLHIVAETGRLNGRGEPYSPTAVLLACLYAYDAIPRE